MTPTKYGKQSERIAGHFRNRVRCWLTQDDLVRMEAYSAETGVSLNFVADNSIINFIQSGQAICTNNDARCLDYVGAKRNKAKDLFIGDKADALLTIQCKTQKISRSNLAQQAILYYISKSSKESGD